MKIKISRLKKICIGFLSLIKEKNKGKLILADDFYWKININDAYNMKIINPEIVVGSLQDDWESLTNILLQVNPITTVDIERLSNIIGVVSYQTDESKQQENTSFTQIKIEDLIKVCDLILNKTIDSGLGEMDLEDVRCYNISLESAYDFKKKPTVSIYSLSKEWENLEVLFLNGWPAPCSRTLYCLSKLILFLGRKIDLSHNKDKWFIN